MIKCQLLVLGSGPGGYAAAFRAADLGQEVVLVEKHTSLGGVCLNVGCIPSKALLHVAGKIRMTQKQSQTGITFGEPEVDLNQVRQFKQQTVSRLTDNLAIMAKQRGVRVVQGRGVFEGPHLLKVAGEQIQFQKAIIAIGSSPTRLPFVPYDDPRVLDSTGALALHSIPQRLLVLGGGIIGLEMATVYQALGSDVTVAELGEQLMPGADKDLVRVFQQANKDRMRFLTGTKVTSVISQPESLEVHWQSNNTSSVEHFDSVLVAVGRRPNGRSAGIPEIGIKVDEAGFIETDSQCRTSMDHILAIGDVVRGPMLAHKASHEGHVAAEVASGHQAYFEPLAIPSIAYTYPEVAWTGLTEEQARSQGKEFSVASFPWSASGRAIASESTQGKTKLLYEKDSHRLIGAGLVGEHAGELLGELTLALEYGATVEDIALTIHAHPSLHESVGLAAELGAGTITDLPNPKSRKSQRNTALAS